MFCSSIRQRPEWAPLVPLLSQSQTPRWQERTLETHDVALPSAASSNEPDFFRFVLLSASDMQSRDITMNRLERLSNLTGGKDVGVIFLLASAPRVNGMVSYMQLQTDLLMALIEIPIIPVSSIESFPGTIFQFQRVRLQASLPPPIANSIKHILPYCSAGAPLSEHNTYVLSDVCNGFRGLTVAVTTKEGQEELNRCLGDQQVEADVVNFWKTEYVWE